VQDRLATAKSLRQAEQLQQCTEQLSACQQEISALKAERDQLLVTAKQPQRSRESGAEAGAEDTDSEVLSASPAAETITLREALKELGEAKRNLTQVRATAAAREQELLALLASQEVELGTVGEQQLDDKREPLPPAAAAAQAEPLTAAAEAAEALQQRELELLQARLTSFAERQQQLEEQLAEQSQENAILTERLQVAHTDVGGTQARAEPQSQPTEDVQDPHIATLQEALKVKELEIAALRSKLGMQAEREQETLAEVGQQLQEFDDLRVEVQRLRQEAKAPRRQSKQEAPSSSTTQMGEKLPQHTEAADAGTAEASAARAREVEVLKSRLAQQAEHEQQVATELAAHVQEVTELKALCAELEKALEVEIAKSPKKTTKAADTAEVEEDLKGDASAAVSQAREGALAKEAENLRHQLGRQAEREQVLLEKLAVAEHQLQTVLPADPEEQAQTKLAVAAKLQIGKDAENEAAAQLEAALARSAAAESTVAAKAKEVEQLRSRVIAQSESELQAKSESAALRMEAESLNQEVARLKEALAKAEAKVEHQNHPHSEGPPHDQHSLKALRMKDQELDQLRARLGKMAEHEQAAVEALNAHEGELDALKEENRLLTAAKESAELVAKRRGELGSDASRHEADSLKETLASKSREMEQLKQRLATQAERQNDIMTKLASKEEEVQQLQSAMDEMCRSKHRQADDEEGAMEHLKQKVSAQNHELESLRSKALLDRSAHGAKLQTAEDRITQLQSDCDSLLQQKEALEEQAARFERLQQKLEKGDFEQQEVAPQDALEALQQEASELREKLMRERTNHAERHQKDRDDLFRMRQRLAATESELSKLQQVVQLEKYQETARQMKQEEEEAARMKYEGYDSTTLPRSTSPVRQERDEIDSRFRSISREREAMKRQLQRADQIREMQADQVADLRRVSGAESLLKAETLLAHRSHQLQKAQDQIEVLKKQVERREHSRASEAETSQRMNEEIGQHKQDLSDLKAQLQEAESDRDAWQQRYKILSDAQKDLESERSMLKDQHKLELEMARATMLDEAAQKDDAIIKQRLQLQEMLQRLNIHHTLQVEGKPVVKCSPLEPVVWIYDEVGSIKRQTRRILRVQVPGRRCDSLQHSSVSATVQALNSGVHIQVSKDPDAPLGVHFVYPEVVRDDAGVWEWSYHPHDGTWVMEEPWSILHGVLIVELKQMSPDMPAALAGELHRERDRTFNTDDELNDARPGAAQTPPRGMQSPIFAVSPIHVTSALHDTVMESPPEALLRHAPSSLPIASTPTPSRNTGGPDAGSRSLSSLRHAIVSVPSEPVGNLRRPWRRFLPESMLRTAGGRTIPASELAVGMLLVGPEGTAQVVAVRWRSPEKHDVVTIPTGRGVFSVVAQHQLVARVSQTAGTMPVLPAEIAAGEWIAVETSGLRAGLHEVMIHGPEDMHEAAVITSTRWKSQRTWTVDAEFSQAREVFLYVQPAALRSGARSSRSQQPRGRPRTPGR